MKDNTTEIKMVAIGEIEPNPNNRNKHPEEQIQRLMEILKYQGWRHPLIVSKTSGLLVVGHGRLEAAKRLGLKEVPVCVQEFESPEQEYAFAVSDNGIASWAELDFAGINDDLQHLDGEFDLEMLGIKNFKLDPMPNIDDFMNEKPASEQFKFVTCPHCEREFDLSTAAVRKI